MTPDRKLNPDVEMEAARLVHPNINWEYDPGADCCVGADDGEVFVPLESDSDAMKLERELRKLGWRFWGYPDGHCFADNRRIMIEMIDADTDALLFLKCVAAMHSLDLYVENV
jgi:hypothetical protein